MKVILSRKGFDSSYGGYPSIVFPDNSMQSLPIPSSNDTVSYSTIACKHYSGSLHDAMKAINKKIKTSEWVDLTTETTCHLDPDLNLEALPRLENWKGCFGQAGAAQGVLASHDIKKDDLFLFFGWFKKFQKDRDSLIPEKGEGKHAIFGYLQIGDVLYTKKDLFNGQGNVPEWLKYHPHAQAIRSERESNCIYIARETCSWNPSIKGYGVFQFDKDLVLTKEGLSRSKWNLPDIFRNVKMSYHSDESWKDGYFQSAHRGQEFVIEENSAIQHWAKKLIEKHRDT